MPFMRRTTVLSMVFGMALAGAAFSSVRAQQPANRTVLDGVYAAEQAKRGEALYTENCAACHDATLAGGIGPALAGMEFIAGWKDRTVGELFEAIKNTMPLTAPGTLTAEQTADAVSFILSFNKFPAGTTAMAADAAPLKAVKFAEPGAASAGAAGAAGAAGTAGAAGPASAAGGGLYSAAQSKRGETVYVDQCAACHDPMLVGGIGPALTGNDFIAAWKGKTVGDLYEKIHTTMPMTAPGTMKPEQVSDVIAYMLSVGRWPAGPTELATDAAALKAVPIGEPPQK
jgi:mono/diheme cytochrome c family protein